MSQSKEAAVAADYEIAERLVTSHTAQMKVEMTVVELDQM